MQSDAVEYQQQQISLATVILKNCYLHCQNCPSLVSSLDRSLWSCLVNDIMKTRCVVKEDCVGVSQLWVLFTRFEKGSAVQTIQAVKEYQMRKTVSSQLYILLLRELILQLTFEETEGIMESILHELCELITTDSEEIVCIMQVVLHHFFNNRPAV